MVEILFCLFLGFLLAGGCTCSSSNHFGVNIKSEPRFSTDLESCDKGIDKSKYTTMEADDGYMIFFPNWGDENTCAMLIEDFKALGER